MNYAIYMDYGKHNKCLTIRKLKLMGDAPGVLFMVDKEFAAKVFTMPASSSE